MFTQDVTLMISSTCFVAKKIQTKLVKGVAYVDVSTQKVKYGTYKVDFEAQIGTNEKISTQVDMEIEKSNAVEKLELSNSINALNAGSSWQFNVSENDTSTGKLNKLGECGNRRQSKHSIRFKLYQNYCIKSNSHWIRLRYRAKCYTSE